MGVLIINQGTQSAVNFDLNGTVNTQVIGIGYGTVSTIGTLPNVPGGSIAVTSLSNLPGGTVGSVVGAGTITNLGSITNIGQIYNAGTIQSGTLLNSGTTTGVGTMSNLGSVTNVGQVYNAGTIQGGSITVTAGTVTLNGGAFPSSTSLNTYSVHLTSNGTTTPTSSTAYISSIAISNEVTGTGSTITIQDKQGTPLKLVNGLSTTALTTTPTTITFQTPIKMVSGIDIITAGVAASTTDVWINYYA